MPKHQLPKPTEAQIKAEIQDFEWISRQYHEILKMIAMKKQGNYPMIPLATMQHHAELLRLEAYHKIPTLWLVELQEMLNQKHITL